MKIFEKSIQWYERSNSIIPSACSTLAKTPSRLFRNYNPFCAHSAQGSHFVDIDGNEWIDCEMAMGTVVWGHNPVFLREALLEQIDNGITFSVAGENEIRYADLLLSKFSQYDSIKFFKNGADAVYAAIRLCRYMSKKEAVLSCEYHGWLDWCSFHYYNKNAEELGILHDITNTSYHCAPKINDIFDMLSLNYKRLACIVLCPSSYTREELQQIVDQCRTYHIYIIFDEITSGVRYGYRGVSGAYNIYPDFLCLSKGLTNGLPLAVCMGSNQSVLIMEKLRISNAHSSENLALAAAIACENAMKGSPLWPSWEEEGKCILKEIKEEIIKYDLKEKLFLKGYPGNFHLFTIQDFYTDPFREILVKKLSREGIFSKGFILFSAAHSHSEMQMVKQIIIDCIKVYSETFEK